MELKCPKCQSPIYSGKAEVCACCEAPLPSDFTSFAQNKAKEMMQREWAQSIANNSLEKMHSSNEPALDPDIELDTTTGAHLRMMSRWPFWIFWTVACAALLYEQQTRNVGLAAPILLGAIIFGLGALILTAFRGRRVKN
jgi:hypothetical protein